MEPLSCLQARKSDVVRNDPEYHQGRRVESCTAGIATVAPDLAHSQPVTLETWLEVALEAQRDTAKSYHSCGLWLREPPVLPGVLAKSHSMWTSGSALSRQLRLNSVFIRQGDPARSQRCPATCLTRIEQSSGTSDGHWHVSLYRMDSPEHVTSSLIFLQDL